MPEKHTLPARLRAGAAAVLLALLLLLRPAAAAMPGAHAQLADLSCRFSHGAQATAEIQSGDRAELHASLTLPGSWALFTFSAVNDGDRPIRLVRAEQQTQTPADVDVSYGISGADEGEVLAPGQACTVSVLVQRAQSAAEADEDGTFALTLCYAAEDGAAPSAGDEGIYTAVCAGAAAGLAILLLIGLRKERRTA